jgi:hypothetical protein
MLGGYAQAKGEADACNYVYVPGTLGISSELATN